MSWSNPTTPNLPDYIAFVQTVMGISPLFLPSVLTPAAPALTPGSGGALNGTVYVAVTYVSALGETIGSPLASATVSSGDLISVASPPAVTGATGWNVYAAAGTGVTLQNADPLTIGTPYDLTALTAGVAPPTTPTASSPWLGYAFDQALALTLSVAGGVSYTLAVYNCAGHIQIRITPDVNGRMNEEGSFTQMRGTFDLLKQSNGLVEQTSNVDTSSTFAVSDALKQLTLTDLNFMKTPWGREALAYMQDYGPSVWALT